MDSLITAAAHALGLGDPLGALNRVALREDAPALALRGIAMAQLGDLARARLLLRRAARAFGPKEAVARARCVVAEAEVALAARDLTWPTKALDTARDILEDHGDRTNAAHARYLELRRHLLLGRLADSERLLSVLDPVTLPPALRAAHELLAAGIAMRRLHAKPAREALSRAAQAAAQARIPALLKEVENAAAMLAAPAARQVAPLPERLLDLAGVESLLTSRKLVIDACRLMVTRGTKQITLARRPVLFALIRALGEASPGDVARDVLIARAFGGKHADESHRARLRVEIGRLRVLLKNIAEIKATMRGFVLSTRGEKIVVLAQPVEEQHASVLAFLSDGESWSSSALALALGASQRTVQRALEALVKSGKAQFFGHGRARRWVTSSIPGFTTTLLLPAPLPSD